MKSDLDDPGLSTPGGFRDQIIGSIIGGLIAAGVILAVLMLGSPTS
jgi:hypothetical protein